MPGLNATISDRFSSLTPGEQKVGQLVYENPHQAFMLKSSQLARLAGVSESTITRFVKKMGYPNFSSLREDLARQTLEAFSTTSRLLESTDHLDSSSALPIMARTDADNVTRLPSQVSAQDFARAVQVLCSARRIYVLGLRSSYALAMYLAFDLRFVLNNVQLLKPGIGDLPEQIMEAGREDVLLVISFRRFTRETVTITESLKKRVGHVIGLTNSDLSPLAALAVTDLICFTDIPQHLRVPDRPDEPRQKPAGLKHPGQGKRRLSSPSPAGAGA